MFKMRARIGGSEEYCSSFLLYRIKGEESLCVCMCVHVRACDNSSEGWKGKGRNR